MNNIYALVHPITNEIRYIGKTKDAEQRHFAHCQSKTKTYVSRWAQKLRADGFSPRMIIIEEGLTEDEWPEAEQFWIAYFKGLGARLTNIAKGGRGMVRVNPRQQVGPFGYTLGVRVPALRKNEMCMAVNDGSGEELYIFCQLSDLQAERVERNAKRSRKGYCPSFGFNHAS